MLENENAERRSAVPNSFPTYAPPQIVHPPGQVAVADPKFHKPLFSLAKQMLKHGKHGKKTGQTVIISHKKARKKPHFW